MIELKSFKLEKLDIEGKHYGLIQGMAMDNKIKLYIARDFIKWLGEHQAISEDKIEVGKMYAIIEEEREIGVVGSLNLTDDGILNVIYAIKKNVRDKGYGKKILEEVTSYYLENIKGIRGIKLTIDSSNKGSKRVALANGYVNKGIEDSGLENWYYDNVSQEMERIGKVK